MHNDLYDKEAYVPPVVEKLTGFFATYLAPDPERRTLSTPS
ncbi:hypothetical protein ABIA33_006352 [Streptacidiphilus sp. MAP12-16]